MARNSQKTEWQAKAIAFVARHGGMFATPVADGGLYLYSRCRGPIDGSVIRDYVPAGDSRELRGLMGY